MSSITSQTAESWPLPPSISTKSGQAPLQHLAHHREVVARLGLRPLDVELAVIVLPEPFRTGDDHGAGRIGAHDMTVVIDFDALGYFPKLKRISELAEDPALCRRLGEMTIERLLGVAFGLIEQPAPRTALGNLDHDFALGACRQRLLQQFAVGKL